MFSHLRHQAFAASEKTKWQYKRNGNINELRKDINGAKFVPA